MVELQAASVASYELVTRFESSRGALLAAVDRQIESD
jgi:hypothetical protein